MLLIARTGIEVLLLVPFTREFALLSPDDYIRTILVEKLAVKGIVIGYDFRFGSRSAGDTTLLREAGERYGFFVEVIDPITLDGEKIGSNRIRRLVGEGDVVTAARLLGRPFSIEGQVIRAKARGRTMGYPTINLKTAYSLIPKNGVYVTEVEIGRRRYGALTNIGHNPTFEEGLKRSIETFILDFEGDLYDETVRLYFRKRIRDEMKFSNAEELKARIGMDVEIGRACLRDET
jgi:riboflavin kinase/FMN adenylyltransferase